MGPTLDERRRREGRTARREPPVAEPAPPAHTVLRLQRELGNQAVQRMLGKPTRPTLARATYVVQAAYMSGDMFGIAAALTVNPQLRVLILKEGDAKFTGLREEQSALYEGFYKAALKQRKVADDDIAIRVKTVTVNDTQRVYKALTDREKPEGRAAAMTEAKLTSVDQPESAGHATTVVGHAYERGDRERGGPAQDKVRDAFTGAAAGPSDKQMKEFLEGRAFPPGKYALLWIRLSGKEKSGGAHAELDSSMEGVRQLKKLVATSGRTPVLIGDAPRKDADRLGAIDMIKFWTLPPFDTLGKVDSRLAQLRLFEYMRTHGYDLISIGMRSGAMEGPALLGIPTIYIEERDNKQHERMEKWLGKVPGWRQAKVGALPTRTGKRYQGGGADVRSVEVGIEAAVKGVATAHGKKLPATRSALHAVYDADSGTFVSNYAARFGGRRLHENIVTALETWHAAYTTGRPTMSALEALEANVVRDSGKPAADVRFALRVPRADNVNLGLGDYLRVVLPSLTPRAGGDAAKAQATASISKWRAMWVGKAGLEKGFSKLDQQLIIDTPPLKDERIARIVSGQPQMLKALDAHVGEPEGTAQRRLATLAPVPFASFIDVYLDLAAPSIVKHVGLPRGTPATRASVVTYGNSEAGKEWRIGYVARLRELHRALFPALQ